MKKIIIIILLILLIPFFIITIKDIDREEVNPTLDLILTETHNSIIDLNNYTLREVFESTTPVLENLVTNGGNPFTATTNWLSEGGNLTISSNNLLHTSTLTHTFPSVRPSTDIFLADNVYYTITKVSVNLTTQATIILRLAVSPFTTIATQETPTNNTFYIIKGGLKPITNGRPRIDVPVVSGDTISTAYMMTFNLTASHGVTETSGTAYDNAVAEIEWLLSKNDGFIQSVGNPFEIVDLTIEQMDYWYNAYTTYSPSYDYIQFGTATAGDYLLLQQLIIDNASEDFKLYRDDVIDEVHYTMTQNVDNIVVSDVDGNELFILYSDDTYISRTSLSDTTTLSFVGYNITGYIDGDFNNTVLAFFWIVPILLVGALFFIILKRKERE